MTAGLAAPRAMRNVLANWTGYVVGLIVSFFLTPLLVHHLGPASYGVWTLLVSLTAYLGLLDLGIRSAVTRYVARSESRGEPAVAAEIAAAAIGILGPLAGAALLASIALGWLAPSPFHVAEVSRATTATIGGLVGAATAVTLMSGALGGVIVGLQRFDLIFVVDVSATVVRGDARTDHHPHGRGADRARRRPAARRAHRGRPHRRARATPVSGPAAPARLEPLARTAHRELRRLRLPRPARQLAHRAVFVLQTRSARLRGTESSPANARRRAILCPSLRLRSS